MSSEVQTRPAASRGRGTGRGGRAGFSTRGGARSATKTTNGDSKPADSLDALEDEGKIGELKKLYGPKTVLIKEMFPDWSDVDILFALQETDGDENLTVTRIAEGTISQWGEVSNQKKEKSRSKVKDASTAATGSTDPTNLAAHRAARGGRGTEGGRGRSRATERGGRAGRGRSAHTPANGTRAKEVQQLSVPTEESSAWESHKAEDEPADAVTIAPAAPAQPAASAPTNLPASTAVPKTWASMLRQSTTAKSVAKPKDTSAAKPAETIEPLPPTAAAVAVEPAAPVDLPAESVKEPEPTEAPTVVIPEIALPPSKDQLTEINLEQVADESHPPVTETARSEAADSWDPRHIATGAIPPVLPLSASQQQHQIPKAPTSGYAATAAKATERAHSSRTPSYQRRILDQEEAVRMPGNREVDRAAVQFGAFSLNGAEDDIDGDREEPETRAQPPDDSPVAHPRASLPPVPQPAPVPESFSTQKPTVALPTASAPVVAPTAPAIQQTPSAAQAAQPTVPGSQQYGRFGQTAAQEASSFGQKPFDSFGQQSTPAAQNQYEGLQQSQPQNQQPAGAFSSTPTDYSSYYTADQQNRGPYNYYNQQYGQQQAGQGQQESSLPSQQRPLGGGYTAPQNDNVNQYPQSSTHPSRFGAGSAGDAQNSGTTTPNPTTQSQQQAGQTTQSQSHAQQQPHASQYPYSHPYYTNPYYSAYMNQYPGYGQGGYGGAPYGKSGVYGQGQYGMSPQAPYDHASTPAGGFGQSSLHRADSGLGGSGLSEYGRAGSAQSGSQPGLGGSGFGSMHETFARGGSYQSQPGQPFNSQAAQPGGASTGSDELKPYGESKAAGGPSPALGGARPGSAANNAPSQTGLPPPQSSQQSGVGMGGGYGGYPGHLQGHGVHGSQAGSGGYGMGGGAQQHNSPYGAGYGGQGFGGNNYYNQPRGWGGNYH